MMCESGQAGHHQESVLSKRGTPAADQEEPANRYQVGSLARGLRVLECFASTRSPMRLTDLARALDDDKATLFRYCATLTHLGYLHMEPQTKTYTLGPKVRELGYAAQTQSMWSELVRAWLPVIVGRFEGAASFAVLDGSEVVFRERAVAEHSLSYNISVGARLPAVQSSIGKVLLAHLSRSERDEILEGTLTKKRRDALERELARVLERGIAVNVGGLRPELNSVAVAVHDPISGQVLGGLNLAGSATLFPEERLVDEVGPELLRIAGEIAASRFPSRPEE